MHAQGLSLGLAFIAATLVLAGPAASAASAPPRGKAAGAFISEHVARGIAWRFGLVHVEEIGLSGMSWEVAGRDRDGNEKALDIDAHDGRILN